MAASEAVIRDRTISVRTISDVTEMTQKQSTVTNESKERVRRNVCNVGIGSCV